MVLRLLVEHLQIDKSLAYAMGARIWQALAGPITIAFLIGALTLPEQGIYYALANILGIQMFFELGLLNVLVSQAGHLSSSLSTALGRLRMRELVGASSRWFGSVSLLFSVCVIVFGWKVLSRTSSDIEWHLPLICLAVVSAATIVLSPYIAVLEGAGFREQVYRVRFLQLLSGSLVVWVSLILGFKLWTLVASAAVQLFWSVYLALVMRSDFFASLRQPMSGRDEAGDAATEHSTIDSGASFSWTRDVLPLQWRLALMSVVYHFATQFFTVIVLTYHSAAEAGRLGMTLSVTAAIQSIATAWIYTKFSLVAAKHGAGDREAAGTIWRRTALVSTAILCLGMLAASGIVALLPLAQLGLERRFIQPWQIAVLGIGCLANHIVSIEGFYVLSRRGKPFLLAALTGFSSTAVATWMGGYLYSTSGIVIGYAVTTAFITLPLHSYVYMRFRRDVSADA